MTDPHAHHHERLHAHEGHDKHAGHSADGFRRKFWLSLVLTIPPLVWGHLLHWAR